jgi:hypothetical protein
MHSLPRLSWRNWLRLAMIPAGGDWRDLPGTLDEGEKRREKFRRLPVTAWDATAETITGPGGSASANIADPRVALEPNDARHRHELDVLAWEQSARTITATATVGGGAPSVADPRLGCEPRSGAYGVVEWDQPSATVTASLGVDNGPAAIADPRLGLAPNDGRHWNKYAVTDWNEPAATVTGTDTRVGSGAPSVADPRFGHVERVTEWDSPIGTVTRSPAPSSGAGAVADPRWGGGRFGVTPWIEPAGTVAGESLPNNGKYSVADPRFADGKKKNWQQVAGVTAWTSPAPTITSGAKIHAGAFQVADPRIPNGRVLTLAQALELDLPPNRWPGFVPIIIAADGTWHRPLTTYELAALQSLPIIFNGAPLVLAGTSHTRWREAIGNLVPPDAALAIANQIVRALLIASVGGFALDSTPIWVAPERRAMVV